jgi:hypothetical protein
MHTKEYNYHNSGHYLSSFLLFKRTFRRLISISVCRWNLLRWLSTETEISSIYCTQMSRLHLKVETECSLRNIVPEKKIQENG